jgi:diguanylate cyclase (GGDEF)-like protein
MRDSFESNAAQPATIGSHLDASGQAWLQHQMTRSVMLTLSTLAAVLICAAHTAFAGANTVPASGIGYLALSLVLFGCALAFWTRARCVRGVLRIRWSLISAAALAASIGYLPSFTEAILNTAPERQFQTACFNASEALYMLAVVLFCAGVARSIVIVDMLQALLFVVLRFNLVYSPATRDHFTLNHLLIGQLMALFLFIVATVACLGAVTHAELQFLRTLSQFFGLRLIGFFLSNQVSYTWLHYTNCSLWDVPGPALLAGFALYLVYTSRSAKAEALKIAPLHSPSITVRSLMPSFLALVNLMVGLFLLPISVPLAAAAISLSLVCYMVRTGLLQAQAAKEKALLEVRNEHLEGLAIRDPLTGIGNRRSLAGIYNRLQASAGSEGLSLLLIDIDYFKQANDCHGHLHGDKVLIALARKLERIAARIPGSHCARLGGDEFALLLLDVSPQEASTMAEELRALFNARAFEAKNGKVSLSIGVASLLAASDLPLEALISYADKALYHAKLQGRNRVEVQPVWDRRIVAEDAAALRLELQRIAG